ncbi:MAG TPA: NAD+ synthase [Nitrososphaerales archaeon]
MGQHDILEKVRRLDYASVAKKIQDFILQKVADARAEGVVLGLSGGIDSAVVAALARRALPEHRVLALLMPLSGTTPDTDMQDAENLASSLGIEHRKIELLQIKNAFMQFLSPERVPEGNLLARIRMTLLYYHSNLLNRIVLGTGDRSEALIGYFTKYGDGGVDALPIGGLYKTQVRALGKYLGLPANIVEKKSSPRLWLGQEAEADIGLPYDSIDKILFCIFDEKRSPQETAKITGNTAKEVESVLKMHKASMHKRATPEICQVL